MYRYPPTVHMNDIVTSLDAPQRGGAGELHPHPQAVY
jgi:hypothetical protein